MSTTVLLAVVFAGYTIVFLVIYGRQRRWSGAFGWPLLVGGALLALGGGGDWFAWGGLAWSFVAAFGLLLVISDVYLTRAQRRRASRVRTS